jgi:hypothetical protein
LSVASYSPRKKAWDFARRADEDVHDQWPEQEVDEGKNKVTMPAEQVDGQEGDEENSHDYESTERWEEETFHG